eukprot:jgi/Botrbrau1/20873/Bobra.0135s0008.1
MTITSYPKRDLQQLLDEIEHPGPSGVFEPIKKYLFLVRKLHLRQPENVVSLGAQLLRSYRGRLKEEELWLIMEQVAMAALDTHSFELAFSILQEIRNQFPDSVRAAKLTEMYFEARGHYDDAEGLLKRQLDERPDCQMMLKRQVALEKTRGDIPKAIELLRKYVDVFMTDTEAWAELADLYVQAQMYPQASFCYEEMLLHNPTNIALYIQYADVVYTMGGSASNFRSARSYYAAALELSGGTNVRAQYGITASTAQLGALLRGRASKEDEEGGELAVLAAKALARRYGEEAPGVLPYVKVLLQAEGFQQS